MEPSGAKVGNTNEKHVTRNLINNRVWKINGYYLILFDNRKD